MKMLNSFANLMAFCLALALVVTALPSTGDSAQLMSPRQNIPAKGISCDGNFGCEGGYCPPNSTVILNLVDQIDDNKVFKNYELIACARCATQAERPADYKQGICAYATKLKTGTVTGKVVKASIDAIVKHGCERCGSVPVVPGAKDDADGNVQINFTRGACETGLCHGKSASTVASEDDSGYPWWETADIAKDSYLESEEESGISLPSDAPDSFASPDAALLGLNCRGSGFCTNICMKKGMMKLNDMMKMLHPDHHNNYKNGEQIACVECPTAPHPGPSICAFPQKMPAGVDMDYPQIMEKMAAIVGHGCTQCGSCPLYPGNNVNTGELTVNFVSKGCGHGICEH